MKFDDMQLMYGDKTYSAKQGQTRKPQPIRQFTAEFFSQTPLTDRQLEYVLIQYSIMSEFIQKNDLEEQFTRFFDTKKRQTGALVDWYKKWH